MGAKGKPKSRDAANLSARHGAGGLSRYPRLCFGRNFLVARSRDNRGRGSKRDGVSPDAWAQALEAMGEHDASIVIAAILQRGDEIKSAGGYLRVLTAKARAGEFSLGPVLMALLRGKAAKTARERKRAG